MWDETDYTARWVQGLCAVFLVLFAGTDAYLLVTSLFGLFYFFAGLTLLAGSARLAWRCGWYAVTGRRNVNRDNF